MLLLCLQLCSKRRSSCLFQVVRDACQGANDGNQGTYVVPVDVTAPTRDLAAYVAAVRGLVGHVDYLFLAAGEISLRLLPPDRPEHTFGV